MTPHETGATAPPPRTFGPQAVMASAGLSSQPMHRGGDALPPPRPTRRPTSPSLDALGAHDRDVLTPVMPGGDPASGARGGEARGRWRWPATGPSTPVSRWRRQPGPGAPPRAARPGAAGPGGANLARAVCPRAAVGARAGAGAGRDGRARRVASPRASPACAAGSRHGGSTRPRPPEGGGARREGAARRRHPDPGGRGGDRDHQGRPAVWARRGPVAPGVTGERDERPDRPHGGPRPCGRWQRGSVQGLRTARDAPAWSASSRIRPGVAGGSARAARTPTRGGSTTTAPGPETASRRRSSTCGRPRPPPRQPQPCPGLEMARRKGLPTILQGPLSCFLRPRSDLRVP